MKHYGDITQIHGDRVPIVDIITGGSPCQDLSVAGKRQGLDGERSGLFMEQIRIIREMHDECRRTDKPIRPRYMVWENVPGAKSSGTPPGEDFRIVLEETARIADSSASIPRLPSGESWSNAGCILGDGWSIAWRVHDAQFWGVPQRRKRIALVADFRGTSAPEILFERQGLSGNTEQSKEERQGSAENLGGCVNAISFQERAGRDGGVKEYSSKPNEPEHSQHSKISTYVIEGNGTRSSHNGDGYAESDVSYTLNATEQHCICFGNGQIHDAISPSYEVSKTLNCMDDPMKIVCLDMGGGKNKVGMDENQSPTLATTHQGEPVVCYSQDAYDKYSESDSSAALRQSGGMYGGAASH